MAKDSPYFKFYVSEYNDGDIQLCSMEAQGLFTNLCSMYWSKEGELFLSKAKRLFKVREKTWKELIDERVIKINEDKISISFLDKQLIERGKKALINAKNGEKGGRPKSENNPVGLSSVSERKANESNKEEKRGEEKIIRGEEKREDTLPLLGIDLSVEKILKDEMWIHNIRHLTKNKNLEGAARSAFLFIETKPQRFKVADLNDLKRTTISWLENDKPITNGNNNSKGNSGNSGKQFSGVYEERL